MHKEVYVVDVTGYELEKSLITVEMGDSYGDGWNRNILGIRQNGYIADTFGENFLTKNSATSLV